MLETIDIKTDKKIHGRFYTRANPFYSALFQEWLHRIPDYQQRTILEPFAGENHIIALLRSANINNSFIAFDIKDPIKNKTPDITIHQQDTIKNFPKNFSLAITNPPYLAKNSATRGKLPYPQTHYDDIYKLSLDVMLSNVDYVAAIVPESFITANIFHHRLYGVISLNYEMFSDTDCPVCLALFVPLKDKTENPKDFIIYWGNEKIGFYQYLAKKKIVANHKNHWRFNDPRGEVGLFAIDNTSAATIKFLYGDEIDSNDIKHTNRGITRIGGLPRGQKLDDIINQANRALTIYRQETRDVFMTAFRGLRKDGCYRRRLAFADAYQLLNHALDNLEPGDKEHAGLSFL